MQWYSKGNWANPQLQAAFKEHDIWKNTSPYKYPAVWAEVSPKPWAWMQRWPLWLAELQSSCAVPAQTPCFHNLTDSSAGSLSWLWYFWADSLMPLWPVSLDHGAGEDFGCTLAQGKSHSPYSVFALQFAAALRRLCAALPPWLTFITTVRKQQIINEQMLQDLLKQEGKLLRVRDTLRLLSKQCCIFINLLTSICLWWWVLSAVLLERYWKLCISAGENSSQTLLWWCDQWQSAGYAISSFNIHLPVKFPVCHLTP